MGWKYFFLTTEKKIKEFEYDRSVLRKQIFTKETQDIILKLKNTNVNSQYDLDFLLWMTEDSMEWEMSKEISIKAQDYSLQNKSFNYLHSLLNNLFSFYCLLPQHRKYCFVKHGYPISLKFKLHNCSPYIVYKEGEGIYETVMISDNDLIKEIMFAIGLLSLPISIENFNVTPESVMFLQYENE